MFTQGSHNAISDVENESFPYFTSEHYKVCKREVFETIIPASDFECLLMTCQKL